MINLTLQNFTQKEIIQNVFSPMVAVISSPQAEEICQKNNLSFVEMLQPFTKLSSDGNSHLFYFDLFMFSFSVVLIPKLDTNSCYYLI